MYFTTVTFSNRYSPLYPLSCNIFCEISKQNNIVFILIQSHVLLVSNFGPPVFLYLLSTPYISFLSTMSLFHGNNKIDTIQRCTPQPCNDAPSHKRLEISISSNINAHPFEYAFIFAFRISIFCQLNNFFIFYAFKLKPKIRNFFIIHS